MSNLRLTASNEEVVAEFYSLKTRSDVARLLDVSEDHLIYYLYRMPIEEKYSKFTISKTSGGERTINTPHKSLKILQKKLNQVLQAVYKPKKCVHGFVKGRSIRTNALRHKKQKYVFNFDLKDFFPSINFGRVRGMFKSKPYDIGTNAATILAQICCFENQLPQGAPTSPIIANMICGRLDSQLQKVARENRCYYTRFADDITFSTSLSEFPSLIAFQKSDDWEIGDTLKSIVHRNGFEVQQNKVRLQNNYHRQVVTGITVNEFPNVSRTFVRQIRAMLYDWDKNGYEVAQETHNNLRENLVHRNPANSPAEFKSVVKGKISFLGMVRDSEYGEDELYTHLIDKYNYLVERDDLGLSPQANVLDSMIFISYARKDEKFAFKLYRNLENMGESIWIDQKQIRVAEKWHNQIEDGLKKCKIMILIVSHSSMKSTNVADEWEFFHTAKKPIIPILLYGSQVILPFQLQRIQWVDFRKAKNFMSNLNKLRNELQAIRENR